MTDYQGQAVYGAAYMVQADPSRLCPYYDGQIFTYPSGGSYLITCGSAPGTAGGQGVPKSTTNVAGKSCERQRAFESC